MVSIPLPPLRELGEDIMLIAERFVDLFNVQFNKRVKGFTTAARNALLAHGWPGNVRELSNCIERGMIFIDTSEIDRQDLVDAIRQGKRLNDGYHGAKSSMTAVLGRMATYSGQEISWNDAVNSNLELAPGLDRMTWDTPAPVQPGDDGEYPVARPGLTKVL